MKDHQPPESSSLEGDDLASVEPSEVKDSKELARRFLHRHPSFEEIANTRADDRDSGIAAREAIGPYKVLEFIGRGGFGDVFLCQENRKPHRKLAVKVIRAGLDTQDVLARFEAEKNALRLMNHPAIARIIDSGATEDGRPYFAMEYIEGERLTEFCSKEQLTLEERLQLFIDICSGVQHAHARSVVHRDLKPSNIMVTRVDGVIRPKIIDFGLVKSLQQPLSDQTLHTQKGTLVGTYEYMSPEQATSAVSEIDTRTDIYALGAILYQLLTGEMALAGLRECSHGEVIDKIGYQEPMRPSLRLRSIASRGSGEHASTLKTSPEVLKRRLEVDLDWVVMKALEKDPERRYQTVQEFARDIENFLSGDVVEARPPSSGYRLKKFVRRNRGVLTATALVFVSLSGVSGWALMEKSKANAATRELKTVVEFQQKQLSGIDVPKSGLRLRDDILAEMREALVREGLAGEALESRILNLEQALDLDWVEVAKNNVMESYFTPALATIDQDFSEQPLVRARLLEALAIAMRELGLFERALPLQEKVLEIRRKHLGNFNPDTLTAINNVGVLLKRQGKLKQAMPFHREALRGMRRVLGNEHRSTLTAINNMGSLLRELCRLDEALPLCQEGLEGRRRVLGSENPSTLKSLNNMGLLFQDQERLSEAKVCFEEALETRRRVLGNAHSSTLASVHNMGVVLRRLGKPGEALTYYREALEGKRRALGDLHPRTLVSIHNLGSLARELDRFEEARSLSAEAVKGARRKYPAGHLHLGIFLHGDAKNLVAMGRFEEAQDPALEGYSILVAHKGSPKRLQKAINNLVDLYQGWHKADPQAGHDKTAAMWQGELATAAEPPK